MESKTRDQEALNFYIDSLKTKLEKLLDDQWSQVTINESIETLKSIISIEVSVYQRSCVSSKIMQTLFTCTADYDDLDAWCDINNTSYFWPSDDSEIELTFFRKMIQPIELWSE